MIWDSCWPLTWSEVNELSRPLLALADIIKVDIQNMEAGRLRAVVEQLGPFGKKLLG